MTSQKPEKKRLLAETKYLRFVDRGGWSYVERLSTHQVVCIAACTPEKSILLVEQFRPPVDAFVIEMPAGLCGDLSGEVEETLETAARRELLEETGYQADNLRLAVTVASSAGLTSEVINIFIATGLEKIAAGGGDASEAMIVHHIPMDEIDEWLISQSTAGKLIDARVYSGLYLLQQI